MSELALNRYDYAPEPLELVEYWAERNGDGGEYIAMEGLLGVLRAPTIEHKAIVSSDRDDVLVDTGAHCVAAFTGNPNWLGIRTNNYGQGGKSESYIDAFVRKAVNEHQPQITPDYEAVAATMRRLRSQGAYVLMNTSIIEGCELAVSEFTAKHFTGCFDGIIFARNHQGTGERTKSWALRQAMEQLDITPRDTAVAHIDDSTVHLFGFDRDRARYGSLHLTGPRHVDNHSDEQMGAYLERTTHRAFKRVERELQEAGALVA